MYSVAEQKILLEMLICERLKTQPDMKTRTSHFYNIIALLKKNGLVEVGINDNYKKNKLYNLTLKGVCIASIIAKHTNCSKKYLKYARDVEIWLE